jgi:dihydroflavonol-4-reductase
MAEAEVVGGDLLEAGSCRAALARCDAVAHLAGYIATVPGERERVCRLNTETTRTLWDVVEATPGIERVLYLASIFALAGGEPDRIVDESSEYNLEHSPVAYFHAKRQAELDTWRRVERGSLPATFVYPCACWGPGDVRLSSSRLLWLYLNRPVPVTFAGGWNLMGVRDAAWGLRVGLEQGTPGDQTIIGGENLSITETFRRLDAELGLGRPRLTLPPKPAEWVGRVAQHLAPGLGIDREAAWIASRHWYYSSEKARREWGYRPRDLATAVRDGAAWFLDHGMVAEGSRARRLRAALGRAPA